VWRSRAASALLTPKRAAQQLLWQCLVRIHLTDVARRKQSAKKLAPDKRPIGKMTNLMACYLIMPQGVSGQFAFI